MNKSYKSIWCQKTGTYVAASEAAKSGARKIKSTAALLAISASILAAEETKAGSLDGGTATGSNGSIAIGTRAEASGTGSIALGNPGSFQAMAVASGTDSMALGNGSTASGHAGTAVGADAKATASMTSAFGPHAQATGVLSTALGGYSVASGYNSVALGAQSTATRANTVAIGNADTQRVITHMAGGSLDTDGANVGQLRGIAAGLGGGAAVNPSGTIAAPVYNVAGADRSNVGAALSALDAATVQFNGAEGAANLQNKKMVNVAAGTVSSGSTEAVNGAQLNATNTTIENLTSQINNGTTGLVQQNATTKAITVAKDTDGTQVDLTGTAGARQLRGVANGTVAAGSLHAVNGGQLHGVSSSVATALGGGSAVNGDGSVSAPTYTVGGTTVNNVGSAITNLDGRVTNVDNRVTTIDGRVTNVEGSVTNLTNNINSGTVGLVKQDATTKAITVASDKAGTQVDLTGTAGARQLRGVANGTVAAGSLHAVNGGQLHGVSSSVATALGGGAAVNGNGTVSAPTYTVGGTTVNNVGSAITNLDGRVTNVDNRVTTIDGRVTNVEGSVTNLTSNINNGTVGLVKQDATTKAITVASDKAGTQVDLTGTAGARQLRGVANGTVAAGSLHAVNGGQLHGVSSSVATALGGGAAVNGNGTVSAPTYTVGGTTVNNVGSAITNLDGRVTTVEGDITNNINNGAVGLVRQDATTKVITVASDKAGTQVDLTGTAGARQLRGVANGTVAADSLHAVNGGQLHGVSSSVATALGGGAAVNGNGTVSAPTYTVGGTTVNNVGSAISNLDGRVTTVDNRVTNVDGRVTNVEGSVTNLTNNINSGTVGLVKQDATTKAITVASDKAGTQVDLTGTAGARQLRGVANGTVAAGSLHAVNGGQLHGVSSSVATALGGGSSVNGDGSVSAPTYTVGGTTVNNVGSAITNLDGRVTTVDNRVTNVDGRVTNVEGSVTNLTNNINNGTTGLVQQDATTKAITVAKDKDGTQVDLTGTAGARQLRGVANGTVAAGSLHAVNGGQLHGVSSSVASALGGGATVNSDGSVSAPTYAVGGNTFNNVGGALTNLDGRVTTIDGRVTNVEGDVTNLANTINNGMAGLVKQDATTKAITVAKDKDGSLVDLTGTAGARQLRGVANGTVAAGSLFAVNGGQLHGVSSSIATALGGGAGVNGDGSISGPTYTVGGTTVNNVGGAITNLDNRVTNVEGSMTQITNNINNGTIGLVKQDAATGHINVATDKGGKVVNVAGTEGTRQLTGVADGLIGAGSTDAVNGSQIFSLTQQLAKGGGTSHHFQADGKSDGSDAAIVRSESRGVAIGSYGEASGNAAVAVGADAKASADNSVALGAGSIADRADTVSVGNADAERQIVNVAAGTQDTDAVNVGQMRSYASQGNSQTLNQANTYTDRQVGAVRRDAHAGTASAMAMAGLPQSVQPGKGMAALGASAYSGESAIALGVSKMSSSGKWVYKAIVSSNTRGNYGSTVSAGFHW